MGELGNADKKLRWLCRRGTKELDLILTEYLESCYESSTVEEKEAFKHLLRLEDMHIYSLLLSAENADHMLISKRVSKLLEGFMLPRS